MEHVTTLKRHFKKVMTMHHKIKHEIAYAELRFI